jgi:hypothetical protein
MNSQTAINLETLLDMSSQLTRKILKLQLEAELERLLPYESDLQSLKVGTPVTKACVIKRVKRIIKLKKQLNSL